jgi:hypothetical protein
MAGKPSDDWQPATVEDVKIIVQEDLASCDPEQKAAFTRYKVEPYPAQILRYGRLESVVVVARRGEEAIYWEDVEAGFNISPVGTDGRILEHWCNQDELGFALNAWIEGRWRSGNFAPAKPVS